MRVLAHWFLTPFFGSGRKLALFQSCGHIVCLNILLHSFCITFTPSSPLSLKSFAGNFQYQVLSQVSDDLLLPSLHFVRCQVQAWARPRRLLLHEYQLLQFLLQYTVLHNITSSTLPLYLHPLLKCSRVCVCNWVFTDVYQSDMIVYVWDRPLTSPSERRNVPIFILQDI